MVRNTPADWANVAAGDQETIEALLHQHGWLVLNLTRKVASPNAAHFDDVRQVGMIGLWKAILSFDPARGNAFSTWAYPWIRNAMSREVKQHTVIRVPQTLRPESEETARLKQRARVTVSLTEPHGDQSHNIMCALSRFPVDELKLRKKRRRSMSRYHQRMAILPLRERRVVQAHFNGALFKDIGAMMGVTRSRAQQIWKRALQRLCANEREMSCGD